jgi:hypothetical protein
MSKVRVVTGEPEKTSLDVTGDGDIDDVLASLNSRRKRFAKAWHGLLLTIGTDQRCHMELNYERTCAEDRSLFAE